VHPTTAGRSPASSKLGANARGGEDQAWLAAYEEDGFFPDLAPGARDIPGPPRPLPGAGPKGYCCN
jgi:hypothetical protein